MALSRPDIISFYGLLYVLVDVCMLRLIARVNISLDLQICRNKLYYLFYLFCFAFYLPLVDICVCLLYLFIFRFISSLFYFPFFFLDCSFCFLVYVNPQLLVYALNNIKKYKYNGINVRHYTVIS